jgi:hypothetical protein
MDAERARPTDEQPEAAEAEEAAEAKSPEDLVREVKDENPDPTTRREAFELGLMEEDESDAGEELRVVEDEELDES